MPLLLITVSQTISLVDKFIVTTSWNITYSINISVMRPLIKSTLSLTTTIIITATTLFFIISVSIYTWFT